MRSLPEDEQEVVLAQLVGRALGEPAPPEPGTAPAGPRPPAGSGEEPPSPQVSVPSGLIQALGAVAAEKLLRDDGVAELAALCELSEAEVRESIRDASAGGGTPLRDYLGLLAEGSSSAQARRKLKLTVRDLEALRRKTANTSPDRRLGCSLLMKTQQRETLRALMSHAPQRGFGPAAGAMSAAAPHDAIRRMLLADQNVEGIARACGLRVDAARAALHDVAADADAGEPLASILRLIGDGRSRAEAARELGISQEELSAALEPLASTPLQSKLAHAFAASAAARPLVGGLGTEMVSAGALGPGAQQMVPVRFPEAQHQRLKDWCATHGFSMAVVVRGLVERFLDEQERRPA